MFRTGHLSGHFSQRQAWIEVVKIKNPDFSYWAWSTPWGHVLSLKSFCWNSVLSWAITYSVLQLVKFVSSYKLVCHAFFSTFWHLFLPLLSKLGSMKYDHLRFYFTYSSHSRLCVIFWLVSGHYYWIIIITIIILND